MVPLRFFCQSVIFQAGMMDFVRCAEPAPRWYFNEPGTDDGLRSLCEKHAGEYVENKLLVTEWKTNRPRPRNSVALVMQDSLVLAVSRKTNLEDFGVPGGKLDPGESPEEALVRELFEETGIVAQEFEWCFQRVDHTDSQFAWCYRVTKWSGRPRQMKERGRVEWLSPNELVQPKHTFSGYNRKLFEHMGIAA